MVALYRSTGRDISGTTLKGLEALKLRVSIGSSDQRPVTEGPVRRMNEEHSLKSVQANAHTPPPRTRPSLLVTNPDLTAEWHPTLNGAFTPEEATPGMGRKVWWICPEGHVWKAEIAARARRRVGCGACHRRRTGATDLATKYPDVAARWHPSKNRDRVPSEVTAHSAELVWWVGCTVDPEHEWRATVADKVRGRGCAVCSGHQVQRGKNDLASKYPEVAEQWHPTKNGRLTPQMVTSGSGRKVWWICEAGAGHEWEATVASRTSSKRPGCRACRGLLVPGVTDLATTHPHVLRWWNYQRNVKTPADVTAGSGVKVWWVCPKDPRHEWVAPAERMARRGPRCSVCRGFTVIAGLNDLASFDSAIASQWHPEKNADRTPAAVHWGSTARAWWICPNGHEYQSSVTRRTRERQGCACEHKQWTKQRVLRLLADLREMDRRALTYRDVEDIFERVGLASAAHGRCLLARLRELSTSDSTVDWAVVEELVPSIRDVSPASVVRRAGASGQAGVYVYSLPHYLNNFVDPETGRTLMKVGCSSTDVMKRFRQQRREVTLAEQPTLLRVYPADEADALDLERRIHEQLRAVGHASDAPPPAGKEWFLTDLETLDTIAVNLGVTPSPVAVQ